MATFYKIRHGENLGVPYCVSSQDGFYYVKIAIYEYNKSFGIRRISGIRTDNEITEKMIYDKNHLSVLKNVKVDENQTELKNYDYCISLPESIIEIKKNEKTQEIYQIKLGTEVLKEKQKINIRGSSSFQLYTGKYIVLELDEREINGSSENYIITFNKVDDFDKIECKYPKPERLISAKDINGFVYYRYPYFNIEKWKYEYNEDKKEERIIEDDFPIFEMKTEMKEQIRDIMVYNEEDNTKINDKKYIAIEENELFDLFQYKGKNTHNYFMILMIIMNDCKEKRNIKDVINDSQEIYENSRNENEKIKSEIRWYLDVLEHILQRNHIPERYITSDFTWHLEKCREILHTHLRCHDYKLPTI